MHTHKTNKETNKNPEHSDLAAAKDPLFPFCCIWASVAWTTLLTQEKQTDVLVFLHQQALACFGAHQSRIKPSAFIQFAANEPVRSLTCLTSDSWHLTNIASFCKHTNCCTLLNEIYWMRQGQTVFNSGLYLSPPSPFSVITCLPTLSSAGVKYSYTSPAGGYISNTVPILPSNPNSLLRKRNLIIKKGISLEEPSLFPEFLLNA